MDDIKDENYDYLFVKNFSQIKVCKICKRLNIDPSNVLRGTASPKTIARVRRAIEQDLKDLERFNLYVSKNNTL
jgi:hypothetical protein